MNPELREAATNWMNACFVKEKVRKCPVCSCKICKPNSYSGEVICHFCWKWISIIFWEKNFSHREKC